MKTFENTRAHEYAIACQGLDCAAHGSVGNLAGEWFGDLDFSEDAEATNRDLYGDRG